MARFFKTSCCSHLVASLYMCTAVLAGALAMATASHAQESNVLGLPAVPQGKPALPPTTSTVKKPVAAARPTDAEIKGALSGNLQLASYYENGLITMRVTTARTFVGIQLRAQALQAARLVQRDTRLACGKLCKPAAMPEPRLQADNTLVFDVVVQDYEGVMTTANMVNLVSGRPVSAGAKPATAPPPAAAPAAAASAASGD